MLGLDLGWENQPKLTTPPIGEIISPLGYALSYSDQAVRDAALQILDVTVKIPAGSALIGENEDALDIDAFQSGSTQ